MKRHFVWTAAAGLLLLAAADDPPRTQKVDLGGVTFEAPAAWTKTQPTSAMRKAQITIKPVEPDKDPAELIVFVFPGGGGGVEANIQRWRNQFQDEAGQPPRIESRTVKGKNVDVTRVECAGTFTDMLNRIGPKPGYHLLGAIVMTADAGYFLKLVGPEKTVVAARDDFDRLIASITRTGS
jgi:hypothetical protein